MAELGNKVAFLTGANRGIGRVTALTLASAGAQLVLAGRDLPGLEETARLIGQTHEATPPLICQLDLLDPSTIQASVMSAIDSFGRIDVLINNAGITGKAVPLWELADAEWDATINTNLKGPFLVSRAVIPFMLKEKSGSIIFIGSVTGKRPFKNRSAYAASKLGLVGMMRTLALELGPHKIRVNLISPGFVAGPRLEGVFENVAESENISLPDARARMREMIPQDEFVSPENISQGVLFLASDRSAGITGEDLNISGGLVMY